MHVFAGALQRFDHLKPGTIFQPQVDNRERGSKLLQLFLRLGDRTHGHHRKSTLAERTCKARPERGVVVQHQKRLVFQSRNARVGLDGFFHPDTPAAAHLAGTIRGATK